tara:strand:- start:703 stop:945 length:243 start_codon:yes stop_codon:yes gene_type:complete
MDNIDKLIKKVEHGKEFPRWWYDMSADAQEFLTVLRTRVADKGIDNFNTSAITQILKEEFDVKISYSAVRRYLIGDGYGK